ncbi:MAG: hypothetical protein AB1452_06205 [Pseudomonadota bacterium]
MKRGKAGAVSLTALLVAAAWSDGAEARPGHRHFRHHHHHGARIVLFAAPVFVPRYTAPAPR